MRNILLASLLVLGLLLGYFSFTNSGRVVVSSAGNVHGALDAVRESIQGESFWRHQLKLAERELSRLRKEPEENRRMRAELKRFEYESRKQDEVFYKEHPELRPTAAERQAELLRQKAEDIENQEFEREMNAYRVQRIRELERVVEVIARRLE